MSIRLRNVCAGLTHFETYNKEPNNDCNCRFEQNFLFCHWLHISMILSSLSGGTEMVLVLVLIRIPKQIEDVDGATNFFGLMVRPKSCNKVSKD